MIYFQSDATLEECLAEFGIESIHPAAKIYPMMPDGLFNDLVYSVGHEGLEVDIILTHDGQLLDGKSRLKACFLSGMPPRFERLDPIYADDYIGFLKRINWARPPISQEKKYDLDRLIKTNQEMLVTPPYGGEHPEIDIGNLEAHPYCQCVPDMTDEEFAELKEDISGSGQLDPIIIFEGMILDGRHRFRACNELGIEPWFQGFDGPDSAKDYVVSKNLKRRNLA